MNSNADIISYSDIEEKRSTETCLQVSVLQ